MNTALSIQTVLRNGRHSSAKRLDLISSILSTRPSAAVISAVLLQGLQQHQRFPDPLRRQQYRRYGTRPPTATDATSSKDSSLNGVDTASAASSPNEGACPITVPRPPLAPLPYIYLRDLPYGRSTELQEHLVQRQIRLRKEREEQRVKMATLSGDGANSTDTSEQLIPKEDGAQDLILLVEHSPTYANGRRNRGERAVSKEEAARLERQGAIYVETLRGGEITFHGPGQLVAYPILDLKPAKLSVRCYVSSLEKAIIATCAEWGIKAMTTKNTGVWINDDKKIAAIGVQIQRYITCHGLALNCNTNLDFFKEIVACGLVGKETTSLSRELNDPSVNVQKVIPTFLKGFGTIFQRKLIPLSEVNPELEKMIHEYVRNGSGTL